MEMKIEDLKLADSEVPAEKLISLFRDGEIEQLKLEFDRDDRNDSLGGIFYKASFDATADVALRGLGITTDAKQS